MFAAAPTLCPRFTESWFNEPGDRRHVVLGQRLRPFCEWHRFLLLSIESPLLIPGAVPALADLEVAVRICRSRYRTPLSHILPPRRRGRVARWFREIHAVWMSRRHPLPFALGAFDAYVRDYVAPPEFWQKEAAGAASVLNNLPEPLSLVSALISGGSFQPDNEAAAWEMPLGRAHWYVAAFAKQAGADLRLRTESDKFLSQMRELKKRYAARKARRAATRKKS